MTATPFKSAGIGALLALATCVGYLLFGLIGWFGEPEAPWAKVAIYPGIWAGWRAWDWDSMAAVEVVQRIEAEFGITISDAEAEAMNTLRDIVLAVHGKIQEKR